MHDIQWTPDMSVGVKEIDDQHKRLFDIIDRLVQLYPTPLNSEEAMAVLTELVEYSDYHFRTEDNYMIDNQYPLFLSHRKEHMTYIKKMGTLITALENKESALTKEILDFLCQWWKTHIVNSDQKYARYIKTQKQKKTAK